MRFSISVFVRTLLCGCSFSRISEPPKCAVEADNLLGEDRFTPPIATECRHRAELPTRPPHDGLLSLFLRLATSPSCSGVILLLSGVRSCLHRSTLVIFFLFVLLLDLFPLLHRELSMTLTITPPYLFSGIKAPCGGHLGRPHDDRHAVDRDSADPQGPRQV